MRPDASRIVPFLPVIGWAILAVRRIGTPRDAPAPNCWVEVGPERALLTRTAHRNCAGESSGALAQPGSLNVKDSK
jgi:hypothetical protein